MRVPLDAGLVHDLPAMASAVTCPFAPSFEMRTKLCPSFSKRYWPSDTNRPRIGGVGVRSKCRVFSPSALNTGTGTAFSRLPPALTEKRVLDVIEA